MRGSNKRSGGGWLDEDRVKYIRMLAVPLLIVVVLIIIILVMDRKPHAQADATDTDSSVQILVQESGSTAESSVAPDNGEYKTDFSQYELKKDEVPEVNILISDYFQAKIDQDPVRLYELFGKTGTEEELEQRRQELAYEGSQITDYQNITCYTRQGMTEDSYIAYVTYEVKFSKADTLAPGMLCCYIVKNEDGSCIIRENVVGAEADFMAEANQNEDVRLLSNQVNEQLRQALETDSLLAGIYKQLRDGAIVRESVEETQPAEVHLVEETSQTETDETAGAETTTAAETTAAPSEEAETAAETTTAADVRLS